ncbi:MAG TPA: hypothetical protein VJC13_00270 [Candidatus Paceibacterota bacterium]|nr:hypothetical protein [uncultured archaeon]
MFNISSFLDKFSKNVADTEFHKKQVIEIIEKNTQLNISPKDIEIKDCVVYIKSSPAVKNKIFIFKNKILENIINSTSIKIVDIK